jgi:glycosyltransferase involved in cell wall biosynthesis
MLLTIAICTYNREAQVRRTLESLTRLEAADGAGTEWEVLLVDNASSDGTVAMARSFSGRLPIRVEIESVRGISSNRNRALALARGEWLAYLDDDVIVHPDWLAAMRRAFARHPEAAFFGGRIIPVFEDRGTDWLAAALDDHLYVFAGYDLGPAEVPADIDYPPVGANMVLRTEAHRRYPYSTAIGRVGLGMISGEETDVFQRMIRDGLGGWFVPDAVVDHVVPSHRQSVRHILRWNEGAGFAASIIEPLAPAVTVFGVPRWMIGGLLRRQAQAVGALLRFDRRAALRAQARAANSLGRLRGFGERRRRLAALSPRS